MKKIFSIIAVVIFAAASLFAQSKKPADLAKMKAEMEQAYKKGLKAAPTKEAKKQAKQRIKEGWTVPTGSRSIEQQITMSQVMAEEIIDDNSNTMARRFIQRNGMSTAGTFNAAQAAARANAQVELASMIKTRIFTEFTNAIDNGQSSEITTVTVEKFHQRADAIVDQTLSFCIPVINLYRRVNNNFEVEVGLAYDRLELMERIKRNLQKELEIEGNELDPIMDKVFCDGIE